MPSAFISYAHEDREFVLALADYLERQGLDVRYDQVALHVGDSLIRAISQEIADGDFLIAVVSPASASSEWCRKELALALTQSINEARVKVLPVRFRGGDMPPELQDTYWADADADNIETLARRVAAAMQAHLQGRSTDAAREAQEAEGVAGPPPHEEVVGDVDVSRIDEVAQRVWDVIDAWARFSRPGWNIADIESEQRRLRWALDALPEHVRGALPLVEQLAEADWDGYFGITERDAAERDLREEMRSVRTQVATGLPVTRRWLIDEYLGTRPVRRDAACHLWQIRRGEESHLVDVLISRTALGADNEHLPKEVVRAKETNGRSVVAALLALDEPPDEVMVSTAGVSMSGHEDAEWEG
jgi:TIR domain